MLSKSYLLLETGGFAVLRGRGAAPCILEHTSPTVAPSSHPHLSVPCMSAALPTVLTFGQVSQGGWSPEPWKSYLPSIPVPLHSEATPATRCTVETMGRQWCSLYLFPSSTSKVWILSALRTGESLCCLGFPGSREYRVGHVEGPAVGVKQQSLFVLSPLQKSLLPQLPARLAEHPLFFVL